jgi:hypothetical protein
MTRGGVLEDTITAILSSNLTYQGEIKSQGYLGEKTERKDSRHKGMKGSLEFHSHTHKWMKLVQAIIAKQKREDPLLVINVTYVFFYPNGEQETVTLPDCEFGDIPVDIGSQGDYVKIKLDFESSNDESSTT